MNPFKYAPLSPTRNEIRVLRPTSISPTRQSPKDESADKNNVVTPDLSMEFELETISLDDKPPYTALSYVWGTETVGMKTIKVNGASFSVGANLESALRHMQYRDIAPAIWIDAICINQQDLAEKNEQIPKMRAIYSGARNVLIWLGPGTEQSEVISDVLDAFSKEFRRKFDVPESPKYALIDYAEFETENDILQFIASVIESTSEASSVFPSAADFLGSFASFVVSREWWFRVWIIQEFVVASKCFFQCGRRKLPFEELGTLLAIVIVLSAMITSSGLEAIAKNAQITKQVINFGLILNLYIFREQFHYRHSQLPTLYECLCSAYCRPQWKDNKAIGATNDRDRIYALLGLTREHLVSLRFEVAYQQGCHKLFIKVAMHLIRTGNLDIFAFCQERPGDDRGPAEAESSKHLDLKKLPSWAPDWTRDILLPTTWWKVGQAGYRALGNGMFSAGSRKFVEVAFSTTYDNHRDEDVLSMFLGGILVGEVLEVKSTYLRSASTEFIHTLRIYGALFREIQILCDRSKEVSPGLYTDVQLDQALWKIPIQDCEPKSDGDEIQRATHLSEARYRDSVPLSEAVALHLESIKQESQTPSIDSLNIVQQASPEMNLYLLSMATGSPIKPFITDKGHIGLGPGSMKEGDIVCIFFGAKVPHILRRRGSARTGHVLVGQAYVYGVMDGEVTQDINSEFQSFQIF
ncbi:Folylpolyglutamate synthetase [Kalmusia sp. IMI 367209]|nr:Folylpolyglutamate synthetase [Kalmusia sp. IMI 367209]